ncbi:platelet endothelial cell adhesion molecule isoform X2 [Cololabis saira]|uniref:platelet endothelial cell adhesion molecule isoform X2 n=1 Tax=Cololabis saira TaxID=129043 RepID=UPI002AD3B758|nr:platelet endothelial cell adhesion molecule isoform X2 [Cololabis saira]
MGVLLLLTSAALCSYFHSGSAGNAQNFFDIDSVELSIEPESEVHRNTNVTLRCKATVNTEGSEVLTRNYTIYKDNEMVYFKTTSSSEDFLYQLPEVRVSNNGNYKCKIDIMGKSKNSNFQALKVTGISKPVLHLNKTYMTEGEEISAWCTAPGENGKIVFYFYDNDKMIDQTDPKSNTAWVKFYPSGSGTHRIRCTYTISVTPGSFNSEESNTANVEVTEIPIHPSLEITPKNNIYEGDPLNITCTVKNGLRSSENTELLLIQNDKILSKGTTSISYSGIAQATAPDLNFVCKLKVRKVVKADKDTVSVTELFSVPTLTMSPTEVFQKDPMQLTCQSERVASERLDKNELIYRLLPHENMIHKGNGEFAGSALQNEYNYTCIVEARGIVKESKTLTIRPKVSVSIPKISASDWLILGSPFTIYCQSENGSLPITYSLWRKFEQINQTTVSQPRRGAAFPLTINNVEEINSYRCEATNGKKPVSSKGLNATVIVPLSKPSLEVIPVPADIAEGHDLYLMCRVEGTPPITFKWYRDGDQRPLNVTITNNQFQVHQIPYLSQLHSGNYSCEAVNYANIPVRSDRLYINVRMAMWKKGLIVGSCLLLVSLLLMMGCVLYYRSKRVKVDSTSVSVWSERKPEPGDEESSIMSNEPDVAYTEVVHPRSVDPTRVPLRKHTDTVYSEVQNSSHGAPDHHDYGSAEYAEFSAEHPQSSWFPPRSSLDLDLPEPVD